jgi:hypothetical protein
MTRRRGDLTPVSELVGAVLADALAASVAHWSARAAHLRQCEADARRYGPPGSNAAQEAKAAAYAAEAAAAERHHGALQQALARLDGSDWPAAELVDGIADDAADTETRRVA